MQITTNQILKFLYVLSGIIFIGVCIEAGGIISNMLYVLAVNPDHAQNFWLKIDLSGLYQFDHGYFFVETFLMSIVAIIKAWIFYLIVSILHDKKLDLSQPFNRELGRFIFRISYLAFLIGLFSVWGSGYSEWFVKQGVKMPDIQYMRLGGGDVWLFMSVTLFVIAQIFKKGIEIQTENELTV